MRGEEQEFGQIRANMIDQRFFTIDLIVVRRSDVGANVNDDLSVRYGRESLASFPPGSTSCGLCVEDLWRDERIVRDSEGVLFCRRNSSVWS